jgi:phosphatidate cytidylyltransferase
LILAPLVIIGIFLLPRFEFALVTAVVFAIAGWEWTRIIGITSPQIQAFYILLLLFTFFLAHTISPLIVLFIALLWWLAALFLVIYYPNSANWWKDNLFLKALMGFLVIVPCWVAMNVIRDINQFYFLFILFLVWGADTGAFFIGRSFGKHKLAPNVSPGKTVEGVLGGIALTLIVAIIGGIIMHLTFLEWIAFLLLAILVALTSVIGDLFESMIKRQANIKDSGSWLPGHGGLLDRIDGLTAAVPIFALGLILMQIN